MSAALNYATVRDALKAEFPELRDPIARLEADWPDEPVGEYILFEDILGNYFDVLLALSPSSERDTLLSRSFAFLERMCAADDPQLVNLAAVALCEVIEGVAGWVSSAERFAGPATWRHLDRSMEAAGGTGEIIDLWGVREAIAAQGLKLSSLPGVSHPADHRRLDTLDAAQRHAEGVAILSTYGTSQPLAVMRAAGARAPAAGLDALAVALADDLGGEEPLGAPGAHYFAIPAGERVWRMHRGDDEHGRLTSKLWLHPELSRSARKTANAVIRGASLDP
jgi:hypothetical protein